MLARDIPVLNGKFTVSFKKIKIILITPAGCIIFAQKRKNEYTGTTTKYR